MARASAVAGAACEALPRGEGHWQATGTPMGRTVCWHPRRAVCARCKRGSFRGGGEAGADRVPRGGAIQCAVDQFRTALGEPHHANTPGPLASGRREINGHGGGSRLHQFAHLHLALSRAGFDVRLRVEPLEGRPPRRTRRRYPLPSKPEALVLGLRPDSGGGDGRVFRQCVAARSPQPVAATGLLWDAHWLPRCDVWEVV